jgi:hypothetical protein
MCDELQNGSLPLLIPTPNGRDDAGTNRDCFLLNPMAKSPLHMNMFRFLGNVTCSLCAIWWSPINYYSPASKNWYGDTNFVFKILFIDLELQTWQHCNTFIMSHNFQAVKICSYCVSGHYPSSCLFEMHSILEIGFCLHLQMKPTHLGSVNRASPYLWTFRWNLHSCAQSIELVPISWALDIYHVHTGYVSKI